MIDNEKSPTELNETISDVTPYSFPKKIWGLIEPYFNKKYNIVVVESYPDKMVDRPTITWRIYQRYPGGGKTGVATAKGPTFHGIRSRNKMGQLEEVWLQYFRIVYEWAVFSPSSEISNDLAWDLENAIRECEGTLKGEFPELSLAFKSQFGDSTLQWVAQNVANVRTLQFEVILPVKTTRISKELKEIDIEFQGNTGWSQAIFTRTDSSTRFYLPIEDGSKITGIGQIRLDPLGSNTPLFVGTDYAVSKDLLSGACIDWNDEYGKTPEVGESFRAEYQTSTLSRRKIIDL